MNPSLTRHFADLSSVSGLQAGSSPNGTVVSPWHHVVEAPHGGAANDRGLNVLGAGDVGNRRTGRPPDRPARSSRDSLLTDQMAGALLTYLVDALEAVLGDLAVQVDLAVGEFLES